MKNLPFIVLGLALFGCGSSAAPSIDASSSADTSGLPGPDAYGWCHDKLTATDGTHLAFDYQPKSTSSADKSVLSSAASPAWVNITGALDGSEQVTVVVIDYTRSAKDPDAGKTQHGVQSLNLTWDAANGRFSAPVTQSLGMWEYVEGDDDAALDVYEFAIEVNGVWLTDPVSGQHNFTYSPHDQSSGNCTGILN